MKFKVEIDDEQKEVEIRMKGSHTKRVWKLMGKMTSDTEDIKEVETYISEIWKIVCECTGLKESDEDNMYEDDIQKLTNYVQNRAKDRIDFLNASPK